MKILQMVDVPWDSGLAHYALVLAQGLKKMGHQVFVSAVPGEKPWLKAHRLGLKTIPMVKLKNLGALRRFGKMGITCIADSPADADALYEQVTAVLTGEKLLQIKRNS